MNIKSITFGAILVSASLFAGGSVAEAYETKAIALSPTHTLLVTTYSETLLNRDGVMPMIAHTGNASHTPLIASFAIHVGSSVINTTNPLSALILSGQPIENGGYAVTSGEKATFMLISIIPNASYGLGSLSAHPTTLPILITTNGKVDSQATKNF